LIAGREKPSVFFDFKFICFPPYYLKVDSKLLLSGRGLNHTDRLSAELNGHLSFRQRRGSLPLFRAEVKATTGSNFPFHFPQPLSLPFPISTDGTNITHLNLRSVFVGLGSVKLLTWTGNFFSAKVGSGKQGAVFFNAA